MSTLPLGQWDPYDLRADTGSSVVWVCQDYATCGCRTYLHDSQYEADHPRDCANGEPMTRRTTYGAI